MILFIAHQPVTLDVRIVHTLWFMGGMFLASFFKVAFDYLAKKLWKAGLDEAKDLAEFHEWKKQKTVDSTGSADGPYKPV